MKPKKQNILIDSRYLKIISAKKADLKESIVFICLNEEKYTNMDKNALRKVAEQLQSIEPDSVYFPTVKNMNIQIFDKEEFRNKKLLVTIKHDGNVSNEQVDDQIRKAIPQAKSITVIHTNAKIDIL